MPPDYKRVFTGSAPDALGNFSMGGPANATYRDQNGNLALSAANTPRYLWASSTNCLGVLVETAATNLCSNYNANPADLTGLTSSGSGSAGGLSLVADTDGLMAAAVDDRGLTVNLKTYVCTGAKRVRLDNSTGTGPAYVEFPGVATSTTANHSMSLFAKCPAGSSLVLRCSQMVHCFQG